MYGKIFAGIYDGTLAEDWRALVTFQQLIVLCDADGIVDMTPTAISRRTGIPIEHIKAGLEILEQPDPDSRTPGEDGRRIRQIDQHKAWGWYLVNHAKYRGLVDADTVRAQTRERVRKHRAAEGLASRETVTACNGAVTPCNAKKRHTETDTNTHKPKQTKKNVPANADPHRQQAIGMGVPADLWDEYIKTRKRLKASNTPLALTTLINRLITQRDAGHDPAALVESANEQGWKTIYPPRETTNGRASRPSGKPDISERLQDRSWFTGTIVNDGDSAGD